MQPVFVDTSFWFALSSRKDPNHHLAKTALFHSGSRLLTTSNAIFSETVTLILSKRGHSDAAAWGEDILRSERVRISRLSEEDEREAWRIFRKHSDQEFSFADCSSFALMRRMGIREALAFDADFEWMGFKAPSTGS